MTTQHEKSCRGEISPQMEKVAADENIAVEKVMQDLASGRAVMPVNPRHEGISPTIVGRSFRTKVNANIGRSQEASSPEEEACKLSIAVSAGADFVMDLSVGKDLSEIRKDLLKSSSLPFGTVPIYEAFARADNSIENFSIELMLDVIAEQAEQGVDFMTLHAGILRAHVGLAQKRLMGIASRGGAITADWMKTHDKENPLYENWGRVLEICRKHDVTVSLGDGLRPGCLADASDEAQFAELEALGELVRSCRESNVQVMVEGPGHVPFNQIRDNMERERDVCAEAPFYVLGPVVVDIAPGYDHITSCIGATAAAFYGASLLCYVTPAEHLGLPTAEDVRQGVIAYRIAAHAADVALGLPGAREADDEMARARMAFDWKKQFELAMDGDTARAKYEQSRKSDSSLENEEDHCSMCGRDFCAVRVSKRLRGE